MTAVTYMLLGAAGAVMASFAASLGTRLAQGRGWSSGRSACDHCGHALSYAETVPLAGFIVLRGRCLQCRGSIPLLHPVAEAIGLILLPLSIAITSGPTGLAIFVIGMGLLAASVTDLRAQRLPDSLTATVAAVGLALAAAAGGERLTAGVVCAAIVGATMLVVRTRIRTAEGDPGLGLGDVKLCAALALWLGPAIAWAIAAAAGAGLLFVVSRRTRPDRIPFGPFIALGGLAAGMAVEGLKWHS